MDYVENVKMHTVTFANGNSVTVSELINKEAVKVLMRHNAGMAYVTTEIVVSEQGARELGKLLVKYHDQSTEFEKERSRQEMVQKNNRLTEAFNRLMEENKKLIDQFKPKKLKRKTA